MADAFRDRIEKLPGHLAKLARSYQDAADGFTGYSAAVRQIAHDATLARTEVSNAQDGVSATAHRQAGYVAPAGSISAANPYDRAVADARSRLSASTARLTHLAEDRRVADTTVEVALRRAHRDGMKNKSWWRKALTVVPITLAVVTIVLLVLAVAAVIALAVINPALIPALLVLAGQALTVLSAAQLGVDGTRTALGQDVSWTELGLDALCCLPIVGALARTLGAGERFAAAAAKVPAALTEGAKYLRTATGAVRAGAGAFVKSLATDVKAIRYVVRMADTGLGPKVFAGIERDGKDLGQMLTDAKDSARSTYKAARRGRRLPSTIGGPKEFDPNSLRGLTSDEVRARVLSDWVKGGSKNGGGEIFRDPANVGRQVRIMPGYAAGTRPDVLTTGPYAVVSQNGVTVKVPLFGNTILS